MKLFFIKQILLNILLFFSFFINNSYASTVTWVYSGTLYNVFDYEGLSSTKGHLSQTPIVGSAWSARVTYDTETQDSWSDPNIGAYYNAILSVNLTLGNDTVLIKTDGVGAMGPEGLENDSNRVTNDASYRIYKTNNTYETSIIDIYPSEFASNDFGFEQFQLYFSHSLASGDKMLMNPPSLESNTLYHGSIWWRFEDDASPNWRYYFDVRGTIDSIKVLPAAVVPVPGAVWLFGSGIIGLFGFKRGTMGRTVEKA